MSFLFGKILWLIAAPANLFMLLLLVGGFAGVAHHAGWRRIGRRLCLILSVLLFLIAIFPVDRLALGPLEKHVPEQIPAKVDGIILLAGDENTLMSEGWGQPVAGITATRYLHFAALSRAYPQAKLAFIGGSPILYPPTNTTNAMIARTLLGDIGVPVDRMMFEDKSRDTYENAMLGLAAVKPQLGENWLLVTSAYHMPRALASFRQAGWTIYPAPTDFHTIGTLTPSLGFDVINHLDGLSLAAHEYYGLFSYWLLGRIDRPWP